MVMSFQCIDQLRSSLNPVRKYDAGCTQFGIIDAVKIASGCLNDTGRICQLFGKYIFVRRICSVMYFNAVQYIHGELQLRSCPTIGMSMHKDTAILVDSLPEATNIQLRNIRIAQEEIQVDAVAQHLQTATVGMFNAKEYIKVKGLRCFFGFQISVIIAVHFCIPWQGRVHAMIAVDKMLG